MKELTQINKNRWETKDGDYIWRDDFGAYIVKRGNTHEITDTFEKAVRILNK